MTRAFYHLLQFCAIVCDSRGESFLSDISTESDLLRKLSIEGIEKITRSDIAQVVSRNYFEAAAEIVKRSHDVGLDVSAAVRSAVSEVRSKLDHLVKLLDPEFFRPQKVPPAFQWTQNDTTVYILLKYSRRFNAPGAVDVSDFNCTFTNTSLHFSAIGGHSGKRFEYALALDFFDYINPDQSSWSVGSVGKVVLTIAKKSVSRWPRLLLTTDRVDNMHYWLEYADKMEDSIRTLPEARQSPLTCLEKMQLYCPSQDSCRDACEGCRGKATILADRNVCAGPPVYSPKEAKFIQSDASRGSIGGVLEVSLIKEHHRWDIKSFNVFLVNNSTQEETLIGKSSNVSNLTLIDIEPTDISGNGFVSLLVVPVNDFGSNPEKALYVNVTNEFVPDACSNVTSIEFEDNDSLVNHLKGRFKFTKPSNPDGATQLSFHFGKNEESKISKGKSFIGETNITSEVLNITTSVPIPSGATHVLVYPKNAMGESLTRVVGAWHIDIKRRPKGLVKNLELTQDLKVKFTKFDGTVLPELTGYTVRLEAVGKKSTKTIVKEIEFIPVSSGESIWTSFSSSIYGEKQIVRPQNVLSLKVCVYLTNHAGIARSGACVPFAEEKKSEEL